MQRLKERGCQFIQTEDYTNKKFVLSAFRQPTTTTDQSDATIALEEYYIYHSDLFYLAP